MTGTGLATEHFDKVAHYLAEGELVPLLGAGVNVCDRTDAEAYEYDRNLPSGRELSELLAAEYEYPPDRDDRADLLRVAQYAQSRLRQSEEEHRLRDSLHRIFRAQYGPTSVHRFLASVPARTGTHILALTTNYDDALEQAFEAAGEPYSVVFYRASREGRCWLRHGGETEAAVIARPERSTAVSLHERSVILKVHGAVDRGERRWINDSYVISEDHYIDFLASTRLETLVPKSLLVPLLDSTLLLMGYRLKDWNLRVILHELWSSRDFGYPASADPPRRRRRRRRDLAQPARDAVRHRPVRVRRGPQRPARRWPRRPVTAAGQDEPPLSGPEPVRRGRRRPGSSGAGASATSVIADLLTSRLTVLVRAERRRQELPAAGGRAAAPAARRGPAGRRQPADYRGRRRLARRPRGRGAGRSRRGRPAASRR